MPDLQLVDVGPRRPVRRYHREVTDPATGARRYERQALAPIGAVAPLTAARARRQPGDLLGCPNPFPRAWLEEPPSWVDDRPDVKICTDPTSPDLGRAAGYLWLWDTCFQDGSGSCRQPIPSQTDYEQWYTGQRRAQVVDSDGETVVEMLVTALPIVEGHSTRGGAQNAGQALRWMDLPEKQGLVGVVVEDEHGALFLGAGVPDLTVAQAAMINRSATSAEWYPVTRIGDSGEVEVLGLEPLGAVLVTSPAFGKPPAPRMHIAASLGGEVPESWWVATDPDNDGTEAGMGNRTGKDAGIMVAAAGDAPVAGVTTDTGDAAPAAAGGDVARLVAEAVAEAFARHNPQAEAVEQAAMALTADEVQSIIDRALEPLIGRVDALEAELQQQRVNAMTVEEVTDDDWRREAEERLQELEELAREQALPPLGAEEPAPA